MGRAQEGSVKGISDLTYHILAIDPGSTAGIASYSSDNDQHAHALYKLTGSRVERYCDYGERIAEAVRAAREQNHPITHVGIEMATLVLQQDDAGKVTYDINNVAMACYWQERTMEICYRLGVPSFHTVAISQWRSRFLGLTRAPDRLTKQVERRKWFKAKAIQRCSELGYGDDLPEDVAEAYGVLFSLRCDIDPSFAFQAGQSGGHQEDLL
ncbi:MAG: hypothetical protein AAGG72_10265 [Pseudomonadota bacterium]